MSPKNVLELNPNFPHLRLKGLSVTGAVLEIRRIGEVQRIGLDRGDFPWARIGLLLDFLKLRGTKEISLLLNEPVPSEFATRLVKYPVVCIFWINEAKGITGLLQSISALSSQLIPTVAVYPISKLPPKGTVRKLLNAGLLELQLLAPKRFWGRLKKEFGKYGVLVSNYPIFQNREFYLKKIEADILSKISELETRRKQLLESRHIWHGYSLLVNQINCLNRGSENKLSTLHSEIERLEAERQRLAEKAGVIRIEKEIADEQKKIETMETTLNPLFIRQNSLYHSRYLLLAGKGILAAYKRMRARLAELEGEMNKTWELLKPLNEMLGGLEKRFSTAIESETELIKLLENACSHTPRELDEFKEKIRELFNILARKQEELTLFNQLNALESELSKLKIRFNSLFLEFEPLCIKISLLESEAGNEYSAELATLRARKDHYWNTKLAPLEARINVLKHRIFELRQSSFFYRLLEFIRRGLEQKINSLTDKAKECEHKIKKLRSSFERELQAGGIFEDFSRIEADLADVAKKIQIQSAPLENQRAYLEYLRQQRDFMFEEAGLAKAILEIDAKIGELYKNLNVVGEKQRELKTRLARILIESGVYEEFRGIGRSISELQERLDSLKTQSMT